MKRGEISSGGSCFRGRVMKHNCTKKILALSIVGLMGGIICIAFGKIPAAGVIWAATALVAFIGYSIGKRKRESER